MSATPAAAVPYWTPATDQLATQLQAILPKTPPAPSRRRRKKLLPPQHPHHDFDLTAYNTPWPPPAINKATTWFRSTYRPCLPAAAIPPQPVVQLINTSPQAAAPIPQEAVRRLPGNRGTHKPPADATLRYRLRPDAAQRQRLLRMLGGARQAYNEVVAFLNNLPDDVALPTPSQAAGVCQLIDNRALSRWKAAARNGYDDVSWLRDAVPAALRQDMANAALAAVRSSPNSQGQLLARKRGYSVPLRRQLLQVGAGDSIAMFKRLIGWVPVARGRRQPPLQELQYDCRLQVDKVGDLYLLVPVRRGETQAPAGIRTVAIDPGVRTFQCWYDPVRGLVSKVGDNAVQDLLRVANRVRQLQVHHDMLPQRAIALLAGRADPWTPPARDHLSQRLARHAVPLTRRGLNRKRRQARRAMARLELRVADLVKDLHRKVVSTLVNNFDHILLPRFNVSQMVRKRAPNGRKRRLNKRTTWAMLALSHFAFRQRLLSTAARLPHVTVQLVSEAWTTKTCDHCGAANDHVGSRKVFQCVNPLCAARTDRDEHAARGIFIRACVL